MNLNVLVTLTANNIHPEGRVVVPGLNMEPQKPVDGMFDKKDPYCDGI